MPKRKVIWWNVQRLLAPTASPLSRALDATPATSWTPVAYEQKLVHLGAVLRAMSGNEPPLLLGFSEVETDAVAKDLLKATRWRRLQLVKDPDARLAGNDVVLFYDPSVLTQVGNARSHNVHNRFATRDLLEVDFATTASGATLTVICAHWPSRRISNSEALRIGLGDNTRLLIQRRLKFSKDELITTRGGARMPGMRQLLERWNRCVLLMGDLNDQPFDTSVADVLGAKRILAAVTDPPRFPKGRDLSAVQSYLERQIRLYNPTWALLLSPTGPTGSHYWGSDWYLLDQVIVSRGLVNSGPIEYVDGSAALFAPRRVDGPNGPIAVTSAAGVPLAFDAVRRKGVSDHLPLTFELQVE